MSEETNSSNKTEASPLGEIEHGPSKFELFMEKNFKKVILLGFVLVVAVAAFIIAGKLGRAKDTSAGSALVAAEDADGYRKVTQDHAGTPAALTARLLLAEQLWNNGSEDDAISTLQALSKEDSDHPAIQQARFALASTYLAQEKADDAKSLLNTILNDEEAKYLHPSALILMGDIEKAAGNDEAAKSFYQRKIDDFPTYGDAGLANMRQSLLGVTPPAVVQPPTPTSTPEAQITPPSPPVSDPVSSTATPHADTDETAASPAKPAEEAQPEREADKTEENQDKGDEN